VVISLLPLGGLVTVAEMTTVGEIQAHQPSVGGHDGLVHLEVGGAAAQALDVDTPLGRVEVESLEGTVLAQSLNLVDVLVAAIVAGAGVALRVLVGHGGAKSIEDGTGGNVLRGDEDDGLALALDLLFLQRGSACYAPIGSLVAKRTMISATWGSDSTKDFSRSWRR
jgi:hypothetical protein